MTKDPEVSRVNQEVSRRIGEHRRNERIGHTDGGVGVLPRSGYADPRCLRSLDFLAARTMQKWPFDQFRSALDLPDAKGRWQNLNASLNGIKLAPVYSDEKEPYSPGVGGRIEFGKSYRVQYLVFVFGYSLVLCFASHFHQPLSNVHGFLEQAAFLVPFHNRFLLFSRRLRVEEGLVTAGILLPGCT